MRGSFVSKLNGEYPGKITFLSNTPWPEMSPSWVTALRWMLLRRCDTNCCGEKVRMSCCRLTVQRSCRQEQNELSLKGFICTFFITSVQSLWSQPFAFLQIQVSEKQIHILWSVKFQTDTNVKRWQIENRKWNKDFFFWTSQKFIYLVSSLVALILYIMAFSWSWIQCYLDHLLLSHPPCVFFPVDEIVYVDS